MVHQTSPKLVTRVPSAENKEGTEKVHGRMMLHTRQGGPDVQLDLSIRNSIKDGDKQLTVTVLVILARSFGGMAWTIANTDAVEHMSQFVCARLDW